MQLCTYKVLTRLQESSRTNYTCQRTSEEKQKEGSDWKMVQSLETLSDWRALVLNCKALSLKSVVLCSSSQSFISEWVIVLKYPIQNGRESKNYSKSQVLVIPPSISVRSSTDLGLLMLFLANWNISYCLTASNSSD